MRNVLSVGALALGVSLLIAAPVAADENQESNSAEEAAVESNPNDRICRRVHVTGSNIPQRVCMKRSEWTELREESQETLQQNRQDSSSSLESD